MEIQKFTLLSLCKGNPQVMGGFHSQRTSNANFLYFLCCYPEHLAEQTVELPLN